MWGSCGTSSRRTLDLGMEAASAAVLTNWPFDVSHKLKFYLVLMANSFLWFLAFEGSQCLGVKPRGHAE